MIGIESNATMWRCRCGAEYKPDLSPLAFQGSGCPRCGRCVPVAVSEKGKWKTYRQHQIEEQKLLLARNNLLKNVPAGVRDTVSAQAADRIKHLQDGAWPEYLKQLIASHREIANCSEEEWRQWAQSCLQEVESMKAIARFNLRKLEEELEQEEVLS